MRTHTLFTLIAVTLCLSLPLPALAQAKRGSSAPRPDPTKAQTEEWLKQHIEAWNDSDVHITVRECRILVLDKKRQRTEIVDLRGLLLPVEVIRGQGPDATLRLRVKDKHSGNFSMFRSCDAQNRFCEDPVGKFQRLPYVDLTVTAVIDFIPTRHTTIDKTLRLERALEHYSKLCGAMEDARNRLF